MSNRKDYGPAGCASGCAKKGAQAALIMGAGAYLMGLAGKLGWHVTTKVLQMREKK